MQIFNFKSILVYSSSDICDIMRINEADVIRGPNCDFALNVFYKNQELF